MIPQIFHAKVMHERLFPKKNKFIYRLYYLALPLPAQEIKTLYLSFDPKDLGLRDGSDPYAYVQKILTIYGFENKIKTIMLMTMPRVLGYIFNPVSFYLCFDESNSLLSVLVEVHNTFGEQHTYFCAHQDCSEIASDEWLEAEKVFHVSPFLPREGIYRFKFTLNENTIGIFIDYFDAQKEKQLITSLTGTLEPLTRSSLNKAFWSYPVVTLKTIVFIHLQAIKLFCKLFTYFKKPLQKSEKLSSTAELQQINMIKKDIVE